MIDKDIILRIYKVMKDYYRITELSLSAKISNLAYDEMMVCFLEIVHKFNGLEYLEDLIRKEDDDTFKIRLAMFILPYNQSYCEKTVEDLVNSDISAVRDSANGFLKGPIEEIKVGYKFSLEKVMRLKKIKPTRNFA